MDAGVKVLWVAALRSGTYTQGRRRLFNPYSNTYCCLGVLCDIAEKYAGIRIKNNIRPNAPPEVIAWAGLNDAITGLLANMNDGIADYLGNPQTFSQIADYIEANL